MDYSVDKVELHSCVRLDSDAALGAYETSGLKKLIAVLVVLVVSFAAVAQDVVVPDPVFRPSSAQKGVRISTDVIALALPVAALAGTLITRDGQGLKQGAFSAAATAGVTLLLKYTVKEERPDRSDWHSFPSGHSAVSFATAAYLQRRYGWKFGAPAYALATYVAWGRVFSKKHHWWDVVAGAAIGAGASYIFTRPWAQKHELSIAPYTDGRTFALSASMTF